VSDGVFWPEFEAWLLEHGIDPGDCYQVQITWTSESVHGRTRDSFDGPVRMEVGLYQLNEQGRPYTRVENNEVATETRMVAMRRLPAVEVVRYRTEDQ
jgi:hypothetical protein